SLFHGICPPGSPSHPSLQDPAAPSENPPLHSLRLIFPVRYPETASSGQNLHCTLSDRKFFSVPLSGSRQNCQYKASCQAYPFFGTILYLFLLLCPVPSAILSVFCKTLSSDPEAPET